MKNLPLMAIFLGVITLTCTKENIQLTGSVSGQLSLYNPSTPFEKQPAKAVKLYLLDNVILSDTVKHKSFRDAILDSATTAETGKYLIDNVPWGHYSLIIAPDGNAYRFVPAGDHSVNDFTLSATAPQYRLDFTSPFPNGVNEDPRRFTINLTFLNPGEKGFIYLPRRQFIQYIVVVPFVIPFFIDFGTTDGPYYLNNTLRSIHAEYGFYYVVGVCTNNYLIDVWDSSMKYYHSFWITWPSLDKMPPNSFWTINLGDKTITKVEEKWN